MAKTRAIPSPPERLKSFSRAGLHRDSFLAKETGPCQDAASGNAPPRQAVSQLVRGMLFTKTVHRAVSRRSVLLPGRYM